MIELFLVPYKTNLKTRLDKEKQEVTAQLQQKAEKAIFEQFKLSAEQQLEQKNVYVTPLEYGAKWDDITDDTVALQDFINDVVNNHRCGILPPGTCKISSAINVPCGYEWSVTGGGVGVSIIKQYADNTAIFNMGYNKTATSCHSIKIHDMSFRYANSQANKIDSTPLYFQSMFFECSFKRLKFDGYYGMKVQSSIGAPWGCVFDELQFTSSCYGGAMDWTGAVNGVPNNKFGRILVTGTNMTKPVFKELRGYNMSIDVIEFIGMDKGVPLFDSISGFSCTIGSIKLENGTYAPTTSLILFKNIGGNIRIGQFYIGGNAMNFDSTNASISVFSSMSGGFSGSIEIDLLKIDETNVTGNVYINYSKAKKFNINDISISNVNTWHLTNISSSDACETMNVANWNNSHVSSDKGDANYNVVLGDPNIIVFNTALTVSRTVELPSDNTKLFNGLRFRIISKGAVNGTNKINITSQSIQKATLSSDNTGVEFVYRRYPSGASGGWFVIDVNSIA